jgi:rhodanese-related sulfurtransferase
VHTIHLDELRDRPRAGHTRLVMTLPRNRHAQAHIPGSIAFDDVHEALAALDHDDDIVLYCSGDVCGATTRAYRVLTARGYGRVTVLRGGLQAWAAAGLPLAGAMAEAVAA